MIGQDLPFARLPLTYAECRARLHRAAATVGLPVVGHPIDAPGPDGAHLTIDVTTFGDADADTLLVLLSGTHVACPFADTDGQKSLISAGSTPSRTSEDTKSNWTRVPSMTG